MKTKVILFFTLLCMLSLLMSACTPQTPVVAPAPAVTQIIQTQIVQGQTVEKVITATPQAAKEPIKIGVSLILLDPGELAALQKLMALRWPYRKLMIKAVYLEVAQSNLLSKTTNAAPMKALER